MPLKGERSHIRRGEASYPDAFGRLYEPPEHLYVLGSVDALEEGLAVIGARKATPYGISCARHFAGMAASRGVVVISGGARGCDSASHEATMDAGSRTVAFLGGGCDEVYPPENRAMFQRIVDTGGALVSEYEWGVPPQPFRFRLRNRLIASLARATLIVEAGLPSGTFSTADEALAADREVLVVPGSITSKVSRGANRLIYQGATPIVDDDAFADQLFAIFGEMRVEDTRAAESPQERTELEEELLSAMKAQEMSLEELKAMAEREKGPDALKWLMVWLAAMQKGGEVAKYRNGRYGPVVRQDRALSADGVR